MRSAFTFFALCFALLQGSGAIQLAPQLDVTGTSSYNGSQEAWPQNGKWSAKSKWQGLCKPRAADPKFIWCKNFARTDYDPPVAPGHFQAMDPDKKVFFFYRGNTESTMEFWWKDQLAQSFGRLCMRGVVQCDSGRAKTDTSGGGGFYIYTRVATKKYAPKFGAGSVGSGPSAPWQLIFDREMGDRLDWWHQGIDGKGKLPVGACSECLWDVDQGPASEATQNGIVKTYKSIMDSKSPTWLQGTDEKTCKNNGCGGMLEKSLKKALFPFQPKGKPYAPPSVHNEQGFLGVISMPRYLRKIVYVSFAPECDKPEKEKEARASAKTYAVAQLKTWNAAACTKFDCDANVQGACKGDLIRNAYHPA